MLLLNNNNNNGDGTKEIVESENKSDYDSARYSRNSTQRPGKNLTEARTMISVQFLQTTALLGTTHIL